MVKLLACQAGLYLDPEKLEAFAIALFCSLLEIFESDLSVQERWDIKNFVKDWCK